MRLVVFDMAGTTVKDDDEVLRAFQATLASAGVLASRDEVNRVMGLTKPEAIRRLLSERAGQLVSAEIVDVLHTDFVARMRAHYADAAEEVPGASDAFARLHAAGVLVALDTGFDRQIAEPIVERLGWRERGLVDAVVTSDEVERGRPHPDLLLEAMRRLGVGNASEVAKVGDTPTDLLEGAAAGCRYVIGVTNGSHARSELERFPHTHLVASVADVPAVVLAGHVRHVA
jgi:phosphonatase-like hydrolase